MSITNYQLCDKYSILSRMRTPTRDGVFHLQMTFPMLRVLPRHVTSDILCHAKLTRAPIGSSNAALLSDKRVQPRISWLSDGGLLDTQVKIESHNSETLPLCKICFVIIIICFASGIQEISECRRVAIFSMWNDCESKVEFVSKGEAAVVDPFGGEGTGLRKRWNWDFWK